MTSNDMVGSRITILDFIKFIGAGVVILLGFLRKTGQIGEQVDNQYFQNYLQQDTGQQNTGNDIILYQDTGSHDAGSTIDFQAICQTKSTLCSKISFIGDFLDNEKANYLNKESSITDFLNTNNRIKPDFTNTLKLMKINNGEGTRRGFATWDTVVLNTSNVLSDDEFNQLSCHELGHIFDLGFLQGSNGDKDQMFTEFNKPAFASNDPSLIYYKLSRQSENIRKDTAKKKDFCSGYGMSNPFEDFSECFNLYLNHNKLFKYTALQNPILAKKYNFIATLLKGKYINPSIGDLALVKSNPNWRTWDTTKIPAKN